MELESCSLRLVASLQVFGPRMLGAQFGEKGNMQPSRASIASCIRDQGSPAWSLQSPSRSFCMESPCLTEEHEHLYGCPSVMGSFLRSRPGQSFWDTGRCQPSRLVHLCVDADGVGACLRGACSYRCKAVPEDWPAIDVPPTPVVGSAC